MFGLSVQELMVVGIVAVLLFGKRLPEVAKSLGKSYRDFRAGLNDIQSQFHSVDREYRSVVSTAKRAMENEFDEPTAPKFEPPTTTAPKFQPPTSEPRAVESQPIAGSESDDTKERASGT